MEAIRFRFRSASVMSLSSVSDLTHPELSKSSMQDLQWKALTKAGSVKAELLVNLQESSVFEHARKSVSTNRTTSVESSAGTVTRARGDLQVCGSSAVEEALHSHHAANVARERMRREMIPLDQLRQGGFPDNSLVYRQMFVIRSYEVGSDKSTSVREIFSFFQEVALNHVQLLGIAGDGFGATLAMNRLGLIWVVTKMQVNVDRYPGWPEVIEVDSWVAQAGKNGMRRDWIMRSYQTGEVLARATSTWCMMNVTTRRLSKIPGDVRSEIEPNFLNTRCAFGPDECVTARRISKLDDNSAQHKRSQLTSSAADLDMNQHVNNLKYINWVLESMPVEHVKTHKLASIVLEYRRECHSTDVVESLMSSETSSHGQASASVEANHEELANGGGGVGCKCTHLLRTQDAGQQEILRGKTTWRPQLHAESISSFPCHMEGAKQDL